MTPAKDILPGVVLRVRRLQIATECTLIADRATRWARRAVLATSEETHEARAAFVRGYKRALQKRLALLAEIEQ